MRKDWLKVDMKGLAQLCDGMGPKIWILREMMQNVFDEPDVTVCVVTLVHHSRGLAKLVVRDDAPEGFADLRLAYTMYAKTPKRKRADASGIFTIGEKMVLSQCKEARITTTKGSVIFDADGNRRTGRKRTEAGSVFEALVRMTKEDIEACEQVFSFIPPVHIRTSYNGEEVECRDPIRVVEGVKLPTVFEHEDGNLRRTQRNTTVEVYEPESDETPTLYELGLPVQATEDKWHYLIRQRVPLSQDRNHVSPSYLRTVRVAVLNAMHDQIKKDDASEQWVRDASSDDRADEDALKRVAKLRWGEKAVSAGPGTDPVALDDAITRGYTVIGSRSMSADEWKQMRRVKAVESADSRFGRSGGSQVSWDSPNIIDDHKHVAKLAEFVARETLGIDITVGWEKSNHKHAATYARGSQYLTFNVKRLPRRWFRKENFDAQLGLIVHEIAHEGGLHYQHSYHDCMEKIAVKLALMRPGAFKKWRKI
jgi:hypothetical protein